MAVVASVAALAALDPQLAPAGVALMGSVVPAAASLAALDSQQALVGVALAHCWWCLEKMNMGIMVLFSARLRRGSDVHLWGCLDVPLF